MSVVAKQAYAFPARDALEHFASPLLYIGWDDHLMFSAPVCLPLPSYVPFSALTENVLRDIYGEHPDFAKIDWWQVQWFKSGKPWWPDPHKTLYANGLRHKDVIRFRTPNLTGIEGCGS
jgi:phenol/toluene 2-monooxygenase (NADH) P4/A4